MKKNMFFAVLSLCIAVVCFGLAANSYADGYVLFDGRCDGCSKVYTPGTVVTLTATPADGSVFVKWTGDYCNDSTETTCTFTMPWNEVHINAQFDLAP